MPPLSLPAVLSRGLAGPTDRSRSDAGPLAEGRAFALVFAGHEPSGSVALPHAAQQPDSAENSIADPEEPTDALPAEPQGVLANPTLPVPANLSLPKPSDDLPERTSRPSAAAPHPSPMIAANPDDLRQFKSIGPLEEFQKKRSASGAQTGKPDAVRDFPPPLDRVARRKGVASIQAGQILGAPSLEAPVRAERVRAIPVSGGPIIAAPILVTSALTGKTFTPPPPAESEPHLGTKNLPGNGGPPIPAGIASQAIHRTDTASSIINQTAQGPTNSGMVQLRPAPHVPAMPAKATVGEGAVMTTPIRVDKIDGKVENVIAATSTCTQAPRSARRADTPALPVIDAALPDPVAPVDSGLIPTPHQSPHPVHPAAPFARQIARNIASQIAVAVTATVDGGTEVALNPEELGRVRMQLTTTDHTVIVTISAERPETADLMRRHIDTLAQELRDQGYRQVNIDIGGRASHGFGGQNAARPGIGGTSTTPPEPTPLTGPSAANRPALRGSSTLDLRL